MTTEVAVAQPAGELTAFQASWDAQRAAERKLTLSVGKFVVMSTPLFMALFIGLLALAISDQQQWFIWVGLGAGMGTVAACLFGLLAGVTVNAHVLEAIEHETRHRAS
jgi:hypothetical protein